MIQLRANQKRAQQRASRAQHCVYSTNATNRIAKAYIHYLSLAPFHPGSDARAINVIPSATSRTRRGMNCGDDWTGDAQHVCALGDKCSNKIAADRANLVYHHDNALFRSLLAALECGRRAARSSRPVRPSPDRRPGRAFRYCPVCRQLNHVRRVRCTACGASRPRAGRRRRATTTPRAPRAHDVAQTPRDDDKSRVQSNVALLTFGRGDGWYEVFVDSVLVSDVEAQCVPTNPLAEISLDAVESADALCIDKC